MGDYSKVGGQNADILRATIDGEAYNEQPTSEISELLLELKEKIEQGGGGGGGTTNYNALSNKPKINGVTLENSKTAEELGINIPSKTSEMINDSGFITKTVNDLTNYTKTSDINTALNEKVNKETGKGLSENDFTNGLKSKLDNIEAFANVNKINTIKVNGTPLTPDSNKAVDIITGAGGDNIFLAQQNTTPASDLIQAYEANKIILISTPPTKETYSYIVQNVEKISDAQCMLSTVYIGTENFADGAKFRKFTVTNTTWSMSEWLPQPKLISGANIKTINGESILGSGNLPISGSLSDLEQVLTKGSEAYNKHIRLYQNIIEAQNDYVADYSHEGLMFAYLNNSKPDFKKITLNKNGLNVSGQFIFTNINEREVNVSGENSWTTLTENRVEVNEGDKNVAYYNAYNFGLSQNDDNYDGIGNIGGDCYSGFTHQTYENSTVGTQNTLSKFGSGKISIAKGGQTEFEVDGINGTVTMSQSIKEAFANSIGISGGNYEVCVEDVGGNVVQIGTIKEDNVNYGIYQFYYRTSSLAATATATAYPLSNILANYSVHDFVDATGITSNGIFIGNGRTDNDNRVIVQQFSKNNKTVTLRTYQNFSGNTALLKIKFIGTKIN